MTQQTQDFRVPLAVAEKLESVRARAWKVRLATALVGGLVVLLAAMGLAMAIDRWAILYSSTWRSLLTLAALTATGLTFAAWILAAWRYVNRVERVAADVDRSVPRLEERWSTIAQLSTPEKTRDVHPAMFRQVAEEANRGTPHVDPLSVVRLTGFTRAAWCLTAVTAILIGAAIMDSHRTGVLIKRFWLPMANISATEIHNVSEHGVVARGESLDIVAELAGSPVNEAKLFLNPEGENEQTITLVPRGDEQNRLTHRLRAVKQPLRYRLRAGDGQTDWQEVAVADRPELAAATLKVIPPEYTQQPPLEFEKLPRRISALIGSELQFAFKPREPVAKLHLDLTAGKQQPLLMDADGWYRWNVKLTENLSLSPILAEEHGLTNRRPPLCDVQARPDKPPVVRILTPNEEIAVRPDDKVPVTFVAKDDVRIGSAELVIYDESGKAGAEPRVLDTIPIPLGEQEGATEVKATIELDLAKYKVADGGSLSFAVRVREDRSLAPTPQETTPEMPASSEPQQTVDVAPQGDAIAEAGSAKPQAVTQPATTQAEAAALQIENPPSDPSGISKAIADAMPEKLKELAAENLPSSASSQTTESNASPSNVTNNSNGETTSERQALNTEGMPRETASEAQGEQMASQSPAAQSQGQPQKDSQEKAPQPETTAGSTPPPNSGGMNQLDMQPASQTSTSNRMRLKIDEWAGSFAGQERAQLEMIIAPQLLEIDELLEKAENLSRSVLDTVDADNEWQAAQGRDVDSAGQQIAKSLQIVEQIEQKSHGTPYAFIGLQLMNIGKAHIQPARREYWKALQTDNVTRVTATRDGWQHTVRARQMLADLTTKFENTQREYALAESIEKVKKMYQVFVENSMALLNPEGDGGGSPFTRKRVEFDVDEEYLARLKEVLEMRNNMRAELARILADDPRLLRRFLDAQQNRSRVLRHELEEMIESQRELNREVTAWSEADEAARPDLQAMLLQRHTETAADLAVDAAVLQDRFDTWLPLAQEINNADVQTAARLLQDVATATEELSADADSYIIQNQQAKLKEPTGESAEAIKEIVASAPISAETIAADAQAMHDQLTKLEVSLRQLGMLVDRSDMAVFAANRLVETRNLITLTAEWMRQLKHHQEGRYPNSAEVEQYRLAMQTDAMAGKLANLEQQMAALLQRGDNKIPENIALKSRELLAALDEQAAPNQLAAVYALRRNQLPRALERQNSALVAIEQAAKNYDEMIKLAIVELDKLPVQDPIASLLQDPTLDELLAELEQEIPMEELLGIPRRPSNLQVVGDFTRMGGDNSLMTGSNRQMVMNQLLQRQRMRQRRLDQAYRRAVARALKESELDAADEGELQLARETVDWNVLLSQLGDDLQQDADKAPPERYRRAIEQYFRQISRPKKSDIGIQ